MSDKRQPTPGPWQCKHVANYETPGHVVLWPDTSKGGVHMRRLDSNGGFLEADATLISAAPDMLTALREVLRTPGLQSSVLALCAAAIAKATGQGIDEVLESI